MGQQRYATGARLAGVVVLALLAGVLGVGPASAAPSDVPAPVQRLAAASGHDLTVGHARVAAHRTALRLPDDDDDQAWLEVDPRCASGTHKAKVAAAVFTSTKVRLDYVLTGTGLHRTGTVRTKADRPVTFTLPSLRTGAYRLAVTLHGRTDVLADSAFEVLPCVQVKASCRALTFTNPVGNPAAYGRYSGHGRSQDFELDLAPGQSLTVRADHSKIDYDLTADEYGDLGHGTAKVRQSCSHGPAQPGDHALQTVGFAACAQPGALASVQLSWSVQPSLKRARYEVLDARQQVVAQGSLKGGRDKELALAEGTYTYRSFANRLTEPFEEISFVVLACVEVTPRCRALDLRNPNAVAVLVVAEGSDDEDAEAVVVGAGKTVTVPWTSTGASVTAYLEVEDPARWSFLSLASPAPWDEDVAETTVPQNC
ncbi:hypothetical protein GCM10022197_37410 [Microlunatus spumicola]|uniref:Secreted protein n=1 Tax=Microlunatus spumicola TaxID=81499 RepID=A0ABP6Y3E4_9ACTN